MSEGKYCRYRALGGNKKVFGLDYSRSLELRGKLYTLDAIADT